MHLTLCPYCTSRREDAQAFVEGQSFLFAATSAILDSGNDKELCAMRKETIERVFAAAAKKHRKPKFSMLFWSCWADSNRRTHPYQVTKSLPAVGI